MGDCQRPYEYTIGLKSRSTSFGSVFSSLVLLDLQIFPISSAALSSYEEHLLQVPQALSGFGPQQLG